MCQWVENTEIVITIPPLRCCDCGGGDDDDDDNSTLQRRKIETTIIYSFLGLTL